MKNNNQNNNGNRFIYTDEDMPGITIIKQPQKQNEGKMRLMQLVSLAHESSKHAKIFDEIVNVLMNDLCIAAGTKKYRIIECEIYYDDGQIHQDPYLYGHEKQGKKLEWYFHYSGIDLTLGNDAGIKGGILIRSILDLKSNTVIGGPLKSLNEILNSAHTASFSSTTEKCPLCLENYSFSEIPGFEKTVRIGLDQGKILNERTNQQEVESYYYLKKYRFILKPYATTKKYSDDIVRNEKRLEKIIKAGKA